MQPQLTRNQSLFPLQSTGIWTEVHPLIPRVDYWGVHFANADTGWAVGEGGAIIKTTNGGGKWIWYESGVENTLRTVAAVNNGQRVIAAGDGGMILISEDAGETWSQLSSPTIRNIWNMQIITEEIGWMVGEGGTALKTSDGGLTWIQQPMPYPTAPYWDLSFIDTFFGYICSNSGIILKTTNGGTSWQIQQAGDTRSLFTIYAFDTLWISAAGFAGKVVYTSNGGNNWINVSGVSAAEINKIKFINDTTGFMACSGFYQSTDRGISWFYRNDFTVSGTSPLTTNISFPTETTGYFTGGEMLLAKTKDEGEIWKRTIVNTDFINVYFKDEQNGFLNTNQLIYKTNNGGYTLDTLDTFPYNEIYDIHSMTFTDSSTGFIGTSSLSIYKTTNSGLSWYQINVSGTTDTIGTFYKIYFLTNSIGFAVANDGKIFKTSDKGENWFVKLSVPSLNTIFSGISSSDDSTIWVVGTNTYPFEIYKSTDIGENWFADTVDFMDMSDVYFKDSLNGWILSSNKLYRTIDGGENWFQDFQISASTWQFKPISSSHFIITGNVYESIDSGNTWTNITTEVGTGFSNLYSPYNYFCIPVGMTGLVMNYTDTTIVPVELLGFTGSASNLKVLLIWHTISEKNNYGFEVQRSANKIEWKEVGFISGKGNTAELQNYSYEDDNIETQIYFYRLKQLDYAGSFKYSEIIEVKISINNFELFQNYPNPANPITKIKYIVPIESLIELYLYDIKGERISTLLNEKQQPGIYTTEIDLRNLSSGVYFYTLKSSAGFSKTKKLLYIK
ncbi:MAG: T9SS type A sorting domain-containing protein [Ignavibacteriaceae bacterium]|nr:T9SS type A sorting domain-containing protein [Ignavibacteriaceae bacterium]